MKAISLLVASVIALGIAAFSIRNPEVVQIDLLVGKVNMALSAAILGAAFLGAMAGGILMVLLRGEDRK